MCTSCRSVAHRVVFHLTSSGVGGVHKERLARAGVAGETLVTERRSFGVAKDAQKQRSDDAREKEFLFSSDTFPRLWAAELTFPAAEARAQ